MHKRKPGITVLIAIAILTMLILPAGNIQAATSQSGTVKILIIGNSYVRENDLPSLFLTICEKNKWKVEVVSHSYNDMELAYMASLPGVQSDVKNGNFDFIILQENSHVILDYTEETITVAKALKKMAPDSSQFMMYETMSYNGQEYRQPLFTAAYEQVAAQIEAEVIHAGQAFWEYADAHPYTAMFTDNQHPTMTGSQVIAQSFYDTLYSLWRYNKTVSFEHRELDIYANDMIQTLVNTPAGSVLTYSSDDPTVATVDAEGVLTGLTYGTTYIYANDEKGNTGRCKVKVGFSDIVKGVTAASVYNPVIWGAENGIIGGFNGGEYFGPDLSCTRAQFVTFLWRLAGKPKASADAKSFSDVDSSMSSFKAINWAVGEGIIVGYKDGTFRPSDTVTRRQVAVMLWRYRVKPEPSGMTSGFADVNSSDSAFKAILWGEERGIIKGSNGYFNPQNGCLRRHVITFLYRYARVYIDPTI